ncbi:nucleotide-diphospho-sugar transferase [Tribonema minus]|uniref:Nucleotide-diphospho-sugar transferase n=1 Tax=Tribonema minus TaxID=303371 RepID=A0A836C6R7_9STRA|nr:nucleotide-diphospho-sugar transferase [Tribonema minus]
MWRDVLGLRLLELKNAEIVCYASALPLPACLIANSLTHMGYRISRQGATAAAAVAAGHCTARTGHDVRGTLPCVSAQGAMLLAGGARVAAAPDGNGGRGVRYVHAFTVDNALARPGDAAFVGACSRAWAACGAQCVWKRDAGPCVVEYTELPPALRDVRAAGDGRLAFDAGNICSHFYTLEFVSDVATPGLAGGGGVAYHVARKAVSPLASLAGEGLEELRGVTLRAPFRVDRGADRRLCMASPQ